MIFFFLQKLWSGVSAHGHSANRASVSPLISVCIPLWSYCADRRALPARHSFIYFTVFHLQTTTNLHQREIHSVYPIGVI